MSDLSSFYKPMKVILYILLIGLPVLVKAQDLSGLGGRTPLTITGTIGTHNTFYHSSNPYQFRSPLTNTLFANLNFDVYGMQIPLSFHFSNESRDFSHPFARFGMSPRYRNLQVHLGYRNMNFSQFTYSSLSFLGAGVDYQYRLLRVAVFTGSLNQSSEYGHGELTPARPNMYHRPAYGIKLGVGNARNYFDLILFNARDDTLSISPMAGENLLPKENLVAGTSFRLALGQRVSISSDLAASAYNDNMRSSGIEIRDVSWTDDYFTPRFGSVLRFAGDIRANISLGRTNSILHYRLIQPEFNSLGTTHLASNIQQIGMQFNTTLFRNTVSTSFGMHYQEDNVTKTQLYTTTGLVMLLNATARVSERVTISGSYNGFDQQQHDGTLAVNDSIRINRLMHNFSLTPAYTFVDDRNRSHSLTASINGNINKNQNALIADPSETNTFSSNAAYTLGLTDLNMNLTGSLGYISSSSNAYSYHSANIGLGAGKRFLEDESLNIQLNVNLTYGEVNDLSRNLSIMTGIASGYTYKQNHTANFRFSFNNIRNQHLDGLYSMHGLDTTVSIGYTYRFSPVTAGRGDRGAGGSNGNTMPSP